MVRLLCPGFWLSCVTWKGAAAFRKSPRSMSCTMNPLGSCLKLIVVAAFKWSARPFSSFRARLRERAPRRGGPCRTAAIELLDECRQRQLPGLLAMVVKLAELFGVEAEFARHLDLFWRESMAFAGVGPELEPVGCSSARHQKSKVRLEFYASIVNHPTGFSKGIAAFGRNPSA